jgi:VanZ family protein
MENRNSLRFIWLLLAAGVTAFIWQQSTLPREQSAEASDAVREVVVAVVGGEETTLGDFLSRFIRKVAHVTEFAALGLCIGAYLASCRTPVRDLLGLAFGLAVASVDELIQVFTGRGPAVTDVLLDLVGFVSAALLLRLLLFAVRLVKEKRKATAKAAAHTQDV